MRQHPFLRLFARCNFFWAVLFSFVLASGCSRDASFSRQYDSVYFRPRLAGRASAKLIIFVHGIGGDVSGTWTNRSGRTWFDLMQYDDPPFPGVAIWPISYDCNSTMEQAVRSVRSKIEGEGVLLKYNEVYIIAHSMGGLVVKRLLIDLNRPNQLDKLRRVKAVLFISTPAQGAPLAEIASVFSFGWCSLQLRDLHPAKRNSFLLSIDHDWTNLMEDRLPSYFPRSYCAYETKKTFGFEVVTKINAETYCDGDLYPVNEDHLSIVKPDDVYSRIHKWALAQIQEAHRLAQEREPKLAKFLDAKNTERLKRDYPLGWALFHVDGSKTEYTASPTVDMVIRPGTVRVYLVTPNVMAVRIPGFTIPSSGNRFFSNTIIVPRQEGTVRRIVNSPTVQAWLEVLLNEPNAVVWVWGFRGKTAPQ